MTDLTTGFSRYLSEEFGTPHSVTNIIGVSAGARRRNILLDAASDDQPLSLVATIVPAMVQQIPVSVEAGVRELARKHGVPVPRVHAVCTESSYVGAPFMLSERIDGETVPRRVLRLVDEHGIGQRVGAQLGDAIGRLHRIDPKLASPELPGDPDTPPALVLLEQTRAAVEALLSERPVFQRTLQWLTERIPGPPPQRTLVHSDIRNGNLIVGDDGLRAILDWECASRFGDPMRDLAWAALRMWRFGNDTREFGGFAGRDIVIDSYQSAGGTFDADHFQWWKVFGTLWWGVGLAAQARSYLDGSVPDIVMAASGRRIPEIEWDLLMLMKSEENT